MFTGTRVGPQGTRGTRLQGWDQSGSPSGDLGSPDNSRSRGSSALVFDEKCPHTGDKGAEISENSLKID